MTIPMRSAAGRGRVNSDSDELNSTGLSAAGIVHLAHYCATEDIDTSATIAPTIPVQ